MFWCTATDTCSTHPIYHQERSRNKRKGDSAVLSGEQMWKALVKMHQCWEKGSSVDHWCKCTKRHPDMWVYTINKVPYSGMSHLPCSNYYPCSERDKGRKENPLRNSFNVHRQENLFLSLWVLMNGFDLKLACMQFPSGICPNKLL